MKKVIFLTGNKHKKEIAETVLSEYGLEGGGKARIISMTLQNGTKKN